LPILYYKNLGLDKTIVLNIFSRIIQGTSGLIILYFIARHLSKEEQGYYFTFSSILAIQVFFELGLTGIITQYVAHENAHLKWTEKNNVIGNQESISRLSSLLRLIVKWYTLISLILFVTLILAGFIFFGSLNKNNLEIQWKNPWILLSIFTSISFLVSPILAFFEGLQKIYEVIKIRLIQQIINIGLYILFLNYDFKLYSAPIASILSFIVIPLWITKKSNLRILKEIWINLSFSKINYLKEIFPFQWKIALSWVSGYFIFQLFNPVLFATEGPVIAGKMGMTLTVLNSIYALTFSWMSTKVPTFSRYIALRQFRRLDILFYKTLKQSASINGIGLILLLFIIMILQHYQVKILNVSVSDRFLQYPFLIYMIVPFFFNHLIASWATYLRCHKKEPMLFQSIVIGSLCAFSTFYFGYKYGLYGITFGYMIVSFISLIWGYLIFISKKKEWHYE
jgi:O-antigen/teichoic acid export membrane protein